MSASFGLASVFGPTLGGYIVDHWDWHWVFWVFLPFGLVALVLIIRLFPSATERRRGKGGLCGSLFLTLTIVPMLLAFSWAGNRYDWLSYEILGLFGFTLIALAVFCGLKSGPQAPCCPWNLCPKLDFHSFQHRRFSDGMRACSEPSCTRPLRSEGVQGVSATSSGFVMMPMTLSMVIASTVSGRSSAGPAGTRNWPCSAWRHGRRAFSMSRMDVDTHLHTTVINIILVGAGLGISSRSSP